MTIAGIAVVRNEQDVIEPFVRHNLKFVDQLFIIENGSVDGTESILQSLFREMNDKAPRLTVIRDDGFADDLAARANRLLRQCKAYDVPFDFVVPLDADEFIAASDRPQFENYLALIPRGGYGIVPWQTFVIHKDWVLEAAVNPPWTIRYYRAAELPQFNKVIVRTEGLDVNDIVLHTGSHEVSASNRAMPSVELPTKLLHYPVRSYEQMLGKCAVGWMSYCAHNPNARNVVQNYHKREMFDAIVSGKKLDVARLSMLYAQTEREIDWKHDVLEYPVAFDYVRKYSSGDPMPAVQLILKSWEQWMGGKS